MRVLDGSAELIIFDGSILSMESGSKVGFLSIDGATSVFLRRNEMSEETRRVSQLDKKEKALPMASASPIIHELAQQLISLEKSRLDVPKSDLDAAIKVCERLSKPFSRLAGPAGYASFLSRSLALAKLELPGIGKLGIGKDGSLIRCNPPSQQQSDVEDTATGLVLIRTLLGLLVTFIGEPLTLTVLLDAWPDESFDLSNVKAEEKP